MKTFLLWSTIVVGLLMIFSGCGSFTEKKSDETVDDITITRTINARIATDPELSSLKITVTTKQREVVLTGTVSSRELKTRLIKLALGVKGVRSVEDKIKVRKKLPPSIPKL